MTTEITETVLVYGQCELDAWRKGDRSLTPAFVEAQPNLANQPKFHFGEMFTLRHYHETEGWKGFAFYALGISIRTP